VRKKYTEQYWERTGKSAKTEITIVDSRMTIIDRLPLQQKK
jgi:hypothetical protein